MRLDEAKLRGALRPLGAVSCVRRFEAASVDDRGEPRTLDVRPADVLLLQAPGRRPPGAGDGASAALSTGTWSGRLKRDGARAKPIDIPAE
jgi:hypothetical protein